jgi:predicted DNA-binding WGR domain protein
MNRTARSIHKTHWTPLPSGARICPCRNQNQNRFVCAASMPRTICGGFMRYPRSPPCLEKRSLIRNWGRIGTSGKTMVQTFDSRAEAIEAFARLERVKRRRGYAAADGKLSKPDDFSGITPPVLPALSVPRPWCQTSKIETRRSSSHDNCQ